MDPTAKADAIAAEVRDWYEQHRETWWDRHAPFLVWRSYIRGCADNFMLKLVDKVKEIAAKYES